MGLVRLPRVYVAVALQILQKLQTACGALLVKNEATSLSHQNSRTRCPLHDTTSLAVVDSSTMRKTRPLLKTKPLAHGIVPEPLRPGAVCLSSSALK